MGGRGLHGGAPLGLAPIAQLCTPGHEQLSTSTEASFRGQEHSGSCHLGRLAHAAQRLERDQVKRRSRGALTCLPCTIPGPGPNPTWATVPSQIVALGSGEAAASSSHSGVQMFPGEILGEGRRENRAGRPHTHFSGSLPVFPLPSGASQPTGAAHQFTRTPY